MKLLHSTEIDGVTCFWVDTGRPTLLGTMRFRFGTADEPLVESGWQHALEHLALHGLDKGSLEVNGSVGLLHTDFVAHGDPAQVADHFHRLIPRLTVAEAVDLEREVSVLRAEGDYRGQHPVARALAWRYGAAGPGVLNYGEVGLGRLTVESLRARAARVFTRGNAVMFFDGPPPADLRLDLADGELLPHPAIVPLDQPAAQYADGALAVSGTTARRRGASLAAVCLERRLSAHLRHDAGATYHVQVDYDPVGPELAHVAAGADLRPEALEQLADRVLGWLDGLAQDGPDADTLRVAREQRRRLLLDPYNAPGLADLAADLHLEGKNPVTHEQILAELDAVTAEDVRQRFVELRATLLLGLPGDAEPSDALPVLEVPDLGGPIAGPTYRHVDWPVVTAALTVGPDHLATTVDATVHGTALTDLAGYLVQGDRRHLVRRDGYVVTLDPDEWRDGPAAVESLDRLVADDLRLPIPVEAGSERYARMSWHRRWLLGSVGVLGHLATRPFVLVVAGVVAAWIALLVLAVSAVGDHVAVRVPILVAGVVALSALAGVRWAAREDRAEASSRG